MGNNKKVIEVDMHFEIDKNEDLDVFGAKLNDALEPIFGENFCFNYKVVPEEELDKAFFEIEELIRQHVKRDKFKLIKGGKNGN